MNSVQSNLRAPPGGNVGLDARWGRVATAAVLLVLLSRLPSLKACG